MMVTCPHVVQRDHNEVEELIVVQIICAQISMLLTVMGQDLVLAPSAHYYLRIGDRHITAILQHA
jgi:hypothetical protein